MLASTWQSASALIPVLLLLKTTVRSSRLVPARQSIFGSQSERALFTAIKSQWTDRFALYPSLPFATLIDLGAMKLRNAEREFLLKTNVDYTLCTSLGKPLLSIEFDGLSHGFSRLGRYVQMHKCHDSAREWKLDLKVRVAASVDFPFIVVSYDEKNLIGEGTHLIIVDGIIGQILANLDFKHRLKNLYPHNKQEIDSTDLEYRDDYIQHLVTEAETLAELEWDPIARAEADLEGRLHRRGLLISHSVEWFHEPALPDLPPGGLLSPGFLEGLQARADAMKRSVWVGCKATLQTPVSIVTETVRIRNIEDARVHPLGITENMAMLLACQQVERILA